MFYENHDFRFSNLHWMLACPHKKTRTAFLRSHEIGPPKHIKMTTITVSRCLGTTVFRGTRNFEPSHKIYAFPRNFYVFTEFCGILYWTVIRGQKRHILMEFGPPYCTYTFHHEIHDCHSGFESLTGRILKILECVAKAQRDGHPAVELIETQVLLIQLWTTASWSRHWRHLNMSVA